LDNLIERTKYTPKLRKMLEKPDSSKLRVETGYSPIAMDRMIAGCRLPQSGGVPENRVGTARYNNSSIN
jgi:hypothetical protein